MSDPVLDIRNVSRSFGDIHAVRDISFHISRAQVVGFIGANGAGKTTTMRIAATLDMPDSGRVIINGSDSFENPETARAAIGWMPDSYGTYSNMTVYEYLDFFARAYNYKGDDRKLRVEEVMEFTELSSISERYVDTLSKGMGQRLCLGRTLLNDPALLILDEPAAGLDPKARVEFKHLVRLLAQEGKAIFISSHILSELEDMCDSLLFIDQGELVHRGSASALKRANEDIALFEIRFLGEVREFEEWAALQASLKIIEPIRDGMRVEIADPAPERLATLLKNLLTTGINVFEFRERERRLEEAFIDFISPEARERREREENNS